MLDGLFHLAATNCVTNTGFLPSLYDGLTCNISGGIEIEKVSDVLVLAGNVLRILLGLSGGIAVIVMSYRP